MNGIFEKILGLIGLWCITGFIVTVIHLLIVVLSAFSSPSYIGEAISEITLTAVLEHLPFPLNWIVGWQINPVSFILDLILQLLIFFSTLYILFKRYGL